MEQAEIIGFRLIDTTIEMLQLPEHRHSAAQIYLGELGTYHLLDFIVARIIRHDQLKIPIRLVEDGAQRLPCKIGAVMAQNKNGERAHAV